VKRWVTAIRAEDAKTGKRSVHQYILDNEPALWNSTHRDMHPAATTYDELVDKTINFGRAVREADPDAVIAGPAEWGWMGYLYSGKDAEAGVGARPDRKAHGDVPFVEYYLQKLREYEQKNGVRVLDVLDLHYYPQQENVYGGGDGATDAKGTALRLRSTRSLWDSSYLDESWIKETIRLLPRMREWIATNYPGRGISIGEWNFGGEHHMSGALATAEALGRFAEYGVTSAFYWTAPPEGSPSIQAFAAYRNFDEKGAHFLDWFVPSTTAKDASLFVSRDDAGKHLVALAINPSPDSALMAKIDVGECNTVVQRQAHTFMRGAKGFTHGNVVKGGSGSLDQVLPPYSITVVDIQLASPMSGALAQ
jgi:hypothetical protein